MYCLHSTGTGYSIASQPWPSWVAYTTLLMWRPMGCAVCLRSPCLCYVIHNTGTQHWAPLCRNVHVYISMCTQSLGMCKHTLKASLVRCASLVALSSTCSSSLFPGLVNCEESVSIGSDLVHVFVRRCDC